MKADLFHILLVVLLMAIIFAGTYRSLYNDLRIEATAYQKETDVTKKALDACHDSLTIKPSKIDMCIMSELKQPYVCYHIDGHTIDDFMDTWGK